mgnify:CR=1 FL=1
MESRSYFYPNILRFGIILSERLLDELLTVHDNYAIVVLINLNTEEVVNYFQMYLKNSL